MGVYSGLIIAFASRPLRTFQCKQLWFLGSRFAGCVPTDLIFYVSRGESSATVRIVYSSVSRKFVKLATVIVQKFDFRSLFQAIVKYQITHLS
jgi:hypothetical protein